MIDDALIAPTLLFRFSTPCYIKQPLWTPRGLELPAEYALPALSALDDRAALAEVRAAWSPQGFGVSLRMSGKQQLPWCRQNRREDSDGLHVWIDTRDTHNVHRATRFCHYFMAMPFGGGGRMTDPVVEMVLINRARDAPRPVGHERPAVRSEKRVDGYLLELFLPANSLTGFDPQEHGRLGFFFAVSDREHGWQLWYLDRSLPFMEDPSLWGTLELVEVPPPFALEGAAATRPSAAPADSAIGDAAPADGAPADAMSAISAEPGVGDAELADAGSADSAGHADATLAAQSGAPARRRKRAGDPGALGTSAKVAKGAHGTKDAGTKGAGTKGAKGTTKRKSPRE